MTKKEIDNLFVDFDEMGFCPTTLCENAEEYATQWRNNMRNAIENHETDLLKEFVEWYKKVLIKDYNDKAYMMNHTEEQEIEDRYYYQGQCHAISRLIVLLDSDLEKFMEERK